MRELIDTTAPAGKAARLATSEPVIDAKQLVNPLRSPGIDLRDDQRQAIATPALVVKPAGNDLPPPSVRAG